MVISPIALITWIIGTGRFFTDDFVPDGATRLQHEHISAYHDVVTISSPMRARQYEPDADQIRRAANMWIEGYRSGKLKPLSPAFVGDTIQDGIKGEIRSCQSAVSLQLHYLAMREARAGKFDQALEDLRAAMVVSQVLRSSDPIAEAACCQEQGHALQKLVAISENLSREQLRDLRAELIDLRDSAPSMERLVRQTAVLLQQGKPNLSPSERWGPAIANINPKGLMSISMADFVAVRPKSTKNIPPAIAQLYLGIRSRDTLNENIERTLDHISMLLNPEQRVGAPVRLAQLGL